MQRSDLEHLIRAAGAITDTNSLSVLVAEREKNFSCVRALLRHGLTAKHRLLDLAKNLLSKDEPVERVMTRTGQRNGKFI